MILICKVQKQRTEEVEEVEKLQNLGIKMSADCEWEDVLLDITNANVLSVFEPREEASESCSESNGMAYIEFSHFPVITNIPFEKMSLWWSKKRQDIIVEWDGESLFLGL